MSRRHIARSGLGWFVRRRCVARSGLGCFVRRRYVAGSGLGVDKLAPGQLVCAEKVPCWVKITCRKVYEETARCWARGRLICEWKVCC